MIIILVIINKIMMLPMIAMVKSYPILDMIVMLVTTVMIILSNENEVIREHRTRIVRKEA